MEEIGAITETIDVAQVVLYVFWIFFAGLIYYLRREDKREGYPLTTERGDPAGFFPGIPRPKYFRLSHGEDYRAPSGERPQLEVGGEPVGPWPGAPLEPTGDPMLSGLGPGAWAMRSEEPERKHDGTPRLAPMRVATDFYVAARDPDPRGKPVLGADGGEAGIVCDIWVDRAEPQIRFLELQLPGSGTEVQPPGGAEAQPPGSAPAADRVLLPIGLARIEARRVKVKSILASQFAQVPRLRNPDQVSQREEDQIAAYYAGGYLYALPSRREPVL